MPDFQTETVTSTVRRWIIPAPEPRGAAAEEISKALAAAELGYRHHFNLPDDEPLRRDALRVRTADGQIVIEWTQQRITDRPTN